MRQQPTDRKISVIIAVAVLAIVIAVGVIWSQLKRPPVLPPEEMPEAPLPTDPRQAELAIEDRALRDALAGMDEAVRRERHEARLQQLEEIKRNADSR